MIDLTRRRCLNHESREAVARCPACGRYFCRECITEHEDQVLCASCLNIKSQATFYSKSRFNSLLSILQFAAGTLLLWIFFYYLGQLLLTMPTSFHEGTVWPSGWWAK